MDAQATGSICVYLLVVSLVPLLNKHIMQGLLGAPAFPYPLTLTAVTTSVASCLLVLLSAIRHACCDRGSHASWVLGPHLAFKLRAVAPVGLLFGVKGGLSNWGLALADVPTHSLLMATDLVWACLFARIINGERPSGPRLAAVSRMRLHLPYRAARRLSFYIHKKNTHPNAHGIIAQATHRRPLHG